jgi:hypothetical protein
MASFRKREGKWQVQIRRRGQPPLSKTFRRRSDAEFWARQIESELEGGIYTDYTAAERTLLSELFER